MSHFDPLGTWTLVTMTIEQAHRQAEARRLLRQAQTKGQNRFSGQGRLLLSRLGRLLVRLGHHLQHHASQTLTVERKSLGGT